jgi:hypothetical protein
MSSSFQERVKDRGFSKELNFIGKTILNVIRVENCVLLRFTDGSNGWINTDGTVSVEFVGSTVSPAIVEPELFNEKGLG